MERKSVFLVLLLVFIVQLSQAEVVELKAAEQPFHVQVINSTIELTTLKFSVNSYQKRDITIDGRDFVLLEKLRKESTIEEKGYPRLPRINRSIIIPDESVMGVTIISADYIEISDIEIAPSKGHFPRTIDPETVSYIFGEVYNNDEFYPAELVELGTPYILRDFRGIVVEVNAFRYNPVKKTLRIYTDVTIEVKKTASGGDNILQRGKPLSKIDPQFEKVYNRHFINFSQLDYPALLEGGGMLIIAYDDFMNEMEPLVEWKNQKGMPTEIVPVSQAGSTANAIRNYILNYYNQSDLGYVLLVGDAPQVPTFSDDSDPVYTLLIGGDNYSDIFVGRFSAENSAQVLTQVERTINYEKFPDPAGDWYDKGLGDADDDGPCNPEQYDYQHISIIANKLLRWNYSQVDSVYTVYGGTTNMIMNYLNQGRSIFNYAGHGWINMVGPVNFTSTNANQLVNDNKLFHFVAVACQPGNFVGHTCLAEDLLRATNHNTGAPTGAIAVFLSRISQTWFPPYDMQDEGVDLLTADSMLTFGGMCYNGSMLMIDLFGNQGVNEFRAWTLFGDPSVYLRSATPYQLSVSHNPEIPIGLASFDVIVSGPSGPFPGAMVCAMNDELYAAGITDNSGHITLTFDPPPTQPGSFTLTVTTSNAIPYITQVNIVTVSGPYIILNNCLIQDEVTGNNNGQLDYGETVQLGITLENVGLAVSGNVTGTLTTDDSLVTIMEDSAVFGQIAPDSTVMLDGAYQFQIAPEVADSHAVVFSLELTDSINSWESNFSIIAHAPDITFSGLSIDDSTGGNGNGNLDPGESATLSVSLENSGSSDAFSVEAQLTSVDPNVTINSAFSQCGDMLVGETVMVIFEVTVSAACPQNYDVDFEVNLTGAGGFAGITNFTTTVGDIMYLPTGPDAYGYYAYDTYDSPEFPVYEWVEISPDSGGSGTQVLFLNDDEVLHYALPFTFQYYGMEYDSITIGTNGWLGMGIITEEDYSNSGIPDADGPPAMIASYWEDLSPQRTNSGKVWQYYDAISHLYIVEFNHVEQFAPTGNFETFQTILYDPVYYSTLTGDGRIKVQYKNMSYASQTEGTIGIENHLENDGIQYLYDGVLDIHAMPVSDGMCILYSIPVEAPDLTVTLTPDSLPIVIPPGGGSFNYNAEIVNNTSNQQIFDVWVVAELPTGSNYEVLNRPGVTLSGGGNISRDMLQNVPGNAPAGIYTYSMFSGNYGSGSVWAQDSFEFEKSGVDASGGNTDWTLTGWDEAITGMTAVTDVYELYQNYPNPFNPITSIHYLLPEAAMVKLIVYNTLGQKVAVLVDGWQDAGYKTVTLNASEMASGIYFYRLQAGDFEQIKKCLLVK